jgi:cyclopropane-fatty-acyl-phospholipid synthase
VADLESLRDHYALTLEHWRARFRANRDEARAIHGERFCRIWEY